VVFGRGEQMAPLDPRTSPAELPDHDIDAEDVRKIRFALALRGYRMSDVDWTLERLGEQISSLRLENAHLRDRLSLEEPEAADPAEHHTVADQSAEGDDQDRWGPPQERLAEREPAPAVDR
jgi:DivIVA domain-containing protein